MKKVYKLFLILIIMSLSLVSCFPLYPYSYGGQGYGGHGYRNYGYGNQGYRGHGDRSGRHHGGYRDRGDWNYNSPHN
jgi:hypothetical protein